MPVTSVSRARGISRWNSFRPEPSWAPKLCHELLRRRYWRCGGSNWNISILSLLDFFFWFIHYEICLFRFQFEPPHHQYLRRQNSWQSLGTRLWALCNDFIIIDTEVYNNPIPYYWLCCPRSLFICVQCSGHDSWEEIVLRTLYAQLGKRRLTRSYQSFGQLGN